MSKIYEALRQAELDRANGIASSNATATPSASAQAVLDAPPPVAPVAEPVSVPRPITSRSVGAAAAWAATVPVSAPEPTMIPMDIPPFDPADVKTFVWNPSLHQLPALEPRGSSVEQFRSLRSRMYEFRDLNTLKSILVSSGLPQEGKSFVAINLAISFARHKAGKVLLIDGDMRRASLHKVLGCAGGPGLTEFLSNKASIAEIMQQPKPSDPAHPLPPGLTSLTFIPGGFQHDKAADLSGNYRFDTLIAAVAPHFDWIVVDSSPVNLVSDGVNLARACDAALLITRGGVTRFETAQRAINELKSSKVLGVVLNAVEDPAESGGYYGYDGYDKLPD